MPENLSFIRQLSKGSIWFSFAEKHTEKNIVTVNASNENFILGSLLVGLP